MSLKEPFRYPIAKQSKTKNQPIKKVQNPQAKKKNLLEELHITRNIT